MKILNLSTYTRTNGGPTQIIHDITEVQLSLGHEVDIVSPYNEGDEFFPLPKGAKLFTFKKGFMGKFYPDFSMGIYEFLKENLDKYDVVHVHGLWNFPGLVALLWKNPKLIKVLTIHGTLGDGAMKKSNLKKKFFGWLIQRRATKKADLIQVHNEKEKQNLINFLGDFKHPNIKLITNGIHFKDFQNLPKRGEFRQKNKIPTDSILLAFLGRLDSIKGFDLLLPAFLKVSKEFPNAQLMIIGPDCGALDYIQNFTKENQLSDKVILTGIKKGKEKIEALNDADIFLFPSYSESFSIAVLEACATGLPVVVSPEIGFAYEVNDSKIGRLVEYSAESIYENIKYLIENPDKRIDFGANGRKMVETKYDINIITKQLVEEIEKVRKNK